MPTCPAGSCNIDDGCGGTCPGCAAGALCISGVCQPCTVSCPASNTPDECGDTLRDALAIGGVIYVCPGLYAGPFDPDTDAEVYGAGSGADPATNTVLTGNDTDYVLFVDYAIDFSITGLRLTDGSAEYGANFRVNDVGATVNATNCVFTEGNGIAGAGVYIDDGVIGIHNCEVTYNSASFVSVNRLAGGLLNEDGILTITNTLFSGNQGAYGGALCSYNSGSNMTIEGCTITNNTVTRYGGGIWADEGTVVLRNCVISDNAAQYGGGIYNDEGVFTIIDTTLTGNTAEDDGGGIYVEDGSVTLAATVSITGNTANNPAPSGGGVYVDGGTFQRNGAEISGNTPDQCEGTGC